MQRPILRAGGALPRCAALGLALVLTIAGCAGPRAARPPATAADSPSPSAASPGDPAPSADPPSPAGTAEPPPEPPTTEPQAVEVWGIPASELATRRLYRVHYEGPDGEGSFRLTLELSSAERYRARAVDLLGRPLWSLSVRGAAGRWVDHRAEVYCEVIDRLDLAGLPLAPFPLAVLPPLLLGRLPEPPAAGRPPQLGESSLELFDESGRRWTASWERGGGGEPAAAPRLARWSLWGEGEESLPVLTWLRSSQGEAVLSDRPAGVQLRWREVVAQPLSEPPEESEPPTGYRQLQCREVYDPAAI